MKVAILVSGEPRFCRELTVFQSRLVGFDSADWFVSVWSQSPKRSDYWRSQGSELVAPNWLNPTAAWAQERIALNLGPGHRLAQLELVDQQQLVFPHSGRDDGVTNVANGWKMFWGNWRTDQMRQAHERATGQPYDLILKIRPDLMLHDTLDLTRCAEMLGVDDRAVIMPDNTRAGYGHAVSDLMAVGRGAPMSCYADCLHSIEQYIAQGKIFHPETILGDYLKSQQMGIRTAGFRIDIRQLGQRISETEYISDFGSWA
jgi:hypothetical protein